MFLGAPGGEVLYQRCFDSLLHLLVEGRLLHGSPAAALQLQAQLVEVVVALASGQQVIPRGPLAYPQMGPAAGEHGGGLLTAHHFPHPQKFGELVFGSRAAELPTTDLAIERHLASPTAEALAQAPAVAPGLKTDLHDGLA